MTTLPRRLTLSLSVGLALSAPFAHAATVNDAVESTIAHNPEVLQKLHEFRSTEHDTDVGRADFYPSVDLSYQSNRQKYDYSSESGIVPQHYTTRGWTASVTQNLFQGLQTVNQVRQLDADSQARYFSVLDTSESLALQAVQAYQDVLLYRQLVQIAKNNYAIHKGILGQIVERVRAGVGRRVDLEQAAGRLALAETNLITDNTNLQDVTARYTRITGSAPPDDMATVPDMTAMMPTEDALMRTAVYHNPSYLGAIATLHSAQAEVDVRRGAFAPTVNLQLSKAPTDNYDGYAGRTNISSAAVIFAVNLFRGGADKARLGSAAEKRNAAFDLRDQACRNLRQNISQAWDSVLKYKAQMTSLLQHQLSTEKARNAYRKQFDIGQRTLLDVLDSENELFSAQRDYLIAQSAYATAQATVLSDGGLLLSALKLQPLDDAMPGKAATAADIDACASDFHTPAMVDVRTIPARLITSDELDDTLPSNVPTVPLPR
ncbi:TolC family outer membrane protein [Paludibacterium sp.]|uniref:TolC family outer membrane protein n=1 Tax=Paludibacterium sp. TaxID=1917523 RepID=UPI0025D5C473|nr:TolC family outer membrane protein [Paludibacterium sp.]MBV8648897.1 TolC family outer membrane protein [Paludibacterium sp.]